MKPFVLLIIALLLPALLPGPCAAVVYVKHDSPGPALNGDSWDTAFHTIQAGLDDAAVTGGEVWVAQGHYVEMLTVTSATVAKGGFAGEGDLRDPGGYVTVIDAQNTSTSGKTVSLLGPATIDGFTVTGGYAGFYCSGSFPTITNNVIRGNKQAAVWLSSSAAIVSGNVIEDNGDGITSWSPGLAAITGNTIRRNGRGVGCYFGSAPVIEGNLIAECSYAGVFCQSSGPTIRNNRLWQNEVYGIYCATSSPYITGNTILGCGHSGIYCATSSPLIANNVIAGNTSLGIICYAGSSPLVANNTVCGSLGGVGSYSSRPVVQNCIFTSNYYGVFVSGGSPKFRGNCVWGNGPFDYVGVEPGEGDISADPLFVCPEAGDFHIRADSPCRDAWIPSGPPPGTVTPGLMIDIDGQPRPEGGAMDIGADESYGESPIVAPRVVYVNAAAPPGGDGSSWATAYNALQAGVDDVLPRGPAQIWVAEGTYPEQVLMRPFAHIYGGFAGVENERVERNWRRHPSVIDVSHLTGEASGIFGANISTVDGFTIRGAYRGVFSYYSGPAVTNNTITGNSYAGISVYNGFPTAANNVITANTSNGAIFVNSQGILTNNTVADNEIGVTCFRGAPLLVNNIAAFNGIGMYIGASAPALGSNNVFGNSTDYSPEWYPHDYDISADPLFADPANGDYHLLPGSPCIDAGWNGAPGLPAVDMDGQGRICWGTVDIGADELWPISAKIDIRPGESPNHINLGSRGLVPVALLSSETFDASSVDPETIIFAGAPVDRRGNRFFCEKKDIDRDGDTDLILWFDSQRLSLTRDSTSATLTGQTPTGWPFEGADSVVTVGR
ncbi:MAG: right-handed parallel beta-helix repeat-containing protein [Armatimonadota bacterium]|nr:right-handed parallel beta-helix repeat-containing protein [Armatimonadota bacterium]